MASVFRKSLHRIFPNVVCKFSRKERNQIIEKALETEEGRKALAESLVKPIIRRIF